MLNLTNMFSMRPDPKIEVVPGGRIVKGRAMSGSKDSSELPPTKLDATVKEKRNKELQERMTKSRVRSKTDNIDLRYRAAMLERGWLSSEAVGYLVGTSGSGAVQVLKRLLLDGKVEKDEVPKDGTPGVKFMWRWK